MMKRHGPDVSGPLSKLIRQKVRIATKASGSATAAGALADVEHGCVMVGVTKGAFSMLDMIEHLLGKTGPADIEVSTWTMGVYDADVLWRFAGNGSMRSIRFLVDPSMFGRKPELTEAFVAAFGGDAIRAVDNHAKFTLIGNDDWRIAISSSMNLNRNARLENYVLIEGDEPYGFYRGIVDRVFAQTEPFWTGKKRGPEGFAALRISDEPASDIW